jgi:predicted negative regulator of RcsB-dependent stress response
MSSEATQTMTVYDLLAWLEANKKGLIVGFVAAVVIGFGIAIYRYNVDQKELAASDALLKLKTSFGSTDLTNQATASEYLKVAQEYPGTTAADRAILLAASALFTQGRYGDAQGEFSKFLRDRPQSPFAATAAYGVATSLEAQGKVDEALTAYQNLSVRFPNSSILEDAKMATARVYESKKQPEQALRIYDEILKAPGVGSAGAQAMTRKDDLLARFPELAKTNAPAATTNAVVLPSTNLTILTPKVSAATNAAQASTTVTNAAAAAATNAAPAKP